MAENKNIPEIRFDGFIDAWEQRKLGDIVDFLDTMRKPLKESDRVSGPYPYYGASGIVDYVADYIFDEELILLSEDGANITDRNYPVCFLAAGKYWVNNHAHVLKAHSEMDNNFICMSMERKDYGNYNTGMAMPKLNKDTCFQIPVDCPSLQEQKKIGDYFRNLDNLITLHQRKYERLKNVKKSMLEKMFPHDGANIPEIRFDGFTEAWEQRKLGTCFLERKENMPDGELISVTIGEGIKKFSELGRHDNSNDDKSKYKKVCVGDIAYNSMRMWQGASGYSPYEGIVSPAYTVLSPISEVVDSKCISYLFKRDDMTHLFQINSQGITSDNWNLKYPALSEIEIMVSPYLEEQHLIADYLSKLDNLITLHQRKYEKLKQIKKSMLEKMFV